MPPAVDTSVCDWVLLVMASQITNITRARSTILRRNESLAGSFFRYIKNESMGLLFLEKGRRGSFM
jgi:hypothetical protein